MDTLRRKAEADVAEISQRLRQSEQRREELTDLKFAHEAELRELRGRSEAGEAGREAAATDARALRESNRALEARAFESEREVERLRMSGAALTQQVRKRKRGSGIIPVACNFKAGKYVSFFPHARESFVARRATFCLYFFYR